MKLSRNAHFEKEGSNGCVMYDWKARGNVGNTDALEEMFIAIAWSEYLEECDY